MSDQEWAGLSTTEWAVVGGVAAVVLLVIDRYIHFTRNIFNSFICCCKIFHEFGPTVCMKDARELGLYPVHNPETLSSSATPPDPLEGPPEQPETVDDTGFKRQYDRDFEQGWHVVALQSDETPDTAEEIIREREKQYQQRMAGEAKNEPVKIVRGVATVGGIQTE